MCYSTGGLERFVLQLDYIFNYYCFFVHSYRVEVLPISVIPIYNNSDAALCKSLPYVRVENNNIYLNLLTQTFSAQQSTNISYLFHFTSNGKMPMVTQGDHPATKANQTMCLSDYIKASNKLFPGECI